MSTPIVFGGNTETECSANATGHEPVQISELDAIFAFGVLSEGSIEFGSGKYYTCKHCRCLYASEIWQND